nr:immunoglobulin light chain junction region [Macaca mulatta]MOY13247.1 immunoglobulin light chain junction region [Macaca mulatta]
CQQGKGSPLTF